MQTFHLENNNYNSFVKRYTSGLFFHEQYYSHRLPTIIMYFVPTTILYM